MYHSMMRPGHSLGVVSLLLLVSFMFLACSSQPTPTLTLTPSIAPPVETEATIGLPTATVAATNATASPPTQIDARIAFHSHRDGNDEIYVMDGDGNKPIRFTN